MAPELDFVDPFKPKPKASVLDFTDPFQPTSKLDFTDPWQTPTAPTGTPPIEEPQGRGAVGLVTALPKGIYGGITRQLPEMVGGALQFTGVAPEIGKKWAEVAEKEEALQPERKGAEWALYEAGRMLGPSILPGGLLGTLGRAVLTASKAWKLGSAGAAGLFGLAQAQATKETALERGIEPGMTPYVTGAIEALGEYFGTKYLGKMMGIGDDAIGKLVRPTVDKMLRTLGVEVGTEMGQNFSEALVEQLNQIRPEAQPWEEAKMAIAPTAIMTLLTGGLAHGGEALQRKIKGEKIDKGVLPTDLMDKTAPPPDVGVSVTPPAPIARKGETTEERNQIVINQTLASDRAKNWTLEQRNDFVINAITKAGVFGGKPAEESIAVDMIKKAQEEKIYRPEKTVPELQKELHSLIRSRKQIEQYLDEKAVSQWWNTEMSRLEQDVKTPEARLALAERLQAEAYPIPEWAEQRGKLAEVYRKMRTEEELAAGKRHAAFMQEQIAAREEAPKPEVAAVAPTLIPSAEELKKDWRKTEGKEHTVYINEKEGITRKVKTKYIGSETKADYLTKIEIHNELFPEAAIKIIGATEDNMPITEQPYIKGRNATLEEIDDFMHKKGFEGDSGRYTNKERGIKITDLGGDNVKMWRGKLIPIDMDMEILEPVAAPTKIEKVKAGLAQGRAVKAVDDTISKLPIVAGAISNKRFAEWIDKQAKDLDALQSGMGEQFLQRLEKDYGVERTAKNFATSIKRQVLTPEKEVTPVKPVTPEIVKPEPIKVISEPAPVIEEEEIVPQTTSLKAIKTKLKDSPTINESMSIIDGADNIAKQYGRELTREYGVLLAEDTADMARQVQAVWGGVTAGELVADRANRSPVILDKIDKTNTILESFIGKPQVAIKAMEEKRGRKKKEAPVIERIIEDDKLVDPDNVIEAIYDERHEPTEGELKIAEDFAETVMAKANAIERKVKGRARKPLHPLLETYKKAKELGIVIRGKDWAQLEQEIEEKLEGLTDSTDTSLQGDIEDLNYALTPKELLAEVDKIRYIEESILFTSGEDGPIWKRFFDARDGLERTQMNTTAYEVLEFIATTMPSWSSTAWAKIFTTQFTEKLKNLPVHFVNMPGASTHYNSRSHTIQINLDNRVGGGRTALSILHEASHGLTVRAIRADPALEQKFIEMMNVSKNALPENIQKVLSLYKDAADIHTNWMEIVENHGNLAVDLAYSHSNVSEFIANTWGSPVMQNHLRSIKLPGTPSISLWQRLVRWVSENVFNAKDYSMLEKVMETVGHEIQSRPESYVNKRFATYLQTKQNLHFELTNHMRDLRQIMDTNQDIKGWQKFIPMHILGKRFEPAKLIMNAWQSGMRLLNRMLWEHEFDVDPTTGKETTKAFLRLSNPLKPQTIEQGLFDQISVEGDKLRRNLTRADIERVNRESGSRANPEQINKVVEAYESVRREYNKAWAWYWRSVRRIATRIYEHRPWFFELQDVMLNQNTQISEETLNQIRDTYGAGEVAKFTRARESMIKAWTAISLSEKHVMDGYMPRMRTQGEYRVNVKDTAGNFIDVQFVANELAALRMKYKLEQEHPGHIIEAHYVTPTPENIFNEFDTKDLQAFVKRITNLMEEGGESQHTIDQFYQSLEQNVASKFKARGFRQHQIQRVGEAGAAITGYKTENVHEVYLAYVRNMVGSIRKMNFAFDANTILGNIEIQKQGGLFEYLRQYRDDMLRNELKADRAISTIRSVAYLYYLAANIKAATVNATQNLVLGIPLYARALRNQGMPLPAAYAKATADLFIAMKDVLKIHMGQQLAPDEMEVLRRAKRDGDTGAMQLQYMSGAMDRTTGSRYTNIVNLLGTPFATVETLNRESAMLAFYRMHKDRMGEYNAYFAAREGMYDVHFPYGKYNYPEMVRAAGLLGQTGHLLSTFRSYSIMYVSTILNAFKGADGRISWKQADVFFGSMAILVALGGMMAPWVDDILDAYERMSGSPVRSNIRKRLNMMGGDTLQAAGMHGIMSVLGIDITGSLKLGVPFLGAGGIEETITGAYSGLEQKGAKGFEAVKLGDYYRALEEFAPAFISNAMKASREYQEGGTTIEGKKVTDASGKQYKPTLPQAVSQALGFRIGERAEISEQMRTYQNTKLAMTNQRNALYAMFRKADTPARRAAVIKEVREYNSDAVKFGGGIPLITMASLRKAIIEKLDKRRLMFDYLFRQDEE